MHIYLLICIFDLFFYHFNIQIYIFFSCYSFLYLISFKYREMLLKIQSNLPKLLKFLNLIKLIKNFKSPKFRITFELIRIFILMISKLRFEYLSTL